MTMSPKVSCFGILGARCRGRAGARARGSAGTLRQASAGAKGKVGRRVRYATSNLQRFISDFEIKCLIFGLQHDVLHGTGPFVGMSFDPEVRACAQRLSPQTKALNPVTAF